VSSAPRKTVQRFVLHRRNVSITILILTLDVCQAQLTLRPHAQGCDSSSTLNRWACSPVAIRPRVASISVFRSGSDFACKVIYGVQHALCHLTRMIEPVALHTSREDCCSLPAYDPKRTTARLTFGHPPSHTHDHLHVRHICVRVCIVKQGACALVVPQLVALSMPRRRNCMESPMPPHRASRSSRRAAAHMCSGAVHSVSGDTRHLVQDLNACHHNPCACSHSPYDALHT
jgi:hypothetical protein